MEFVYTKNLEKDSHEITSEAHLEKYLLKNWEEFFFMEFLTTRKKISKKSIIDILAKKEDTFIILELKFRPLRKKDKLQLCRYIKDLSKTKKGNIKGVLIGYNHLTQKLSVIL